MSSVVLITVHSCYFDRHGFQCHLVSRWVMLFMISMTGCTCFSVLPRKLCAYLKSEMDLARLSSTANFAYCHLIPVMKASVTWSFCTDTWGVWYTSPGTLLSQSLTLRLLLRRLWAVYFCFWMGFHTSVCKGCAESFDHPVSNYPVLLKSSSFFLTETVVLISLACSMIQLRMSFSLHGWEKFVVDRKCTSLDSS